MNTWLSVLVVVPACILSAAVCVPSSWANAGAERVRRFVTAVAGAQLLLAATLCIGVTAGLVSVSNSVVPVMFDGVASLMFLLVSFVGWIICNYSIRYLDGEQNQGNYYRWIGFTLGSVSLMVVAGNLLVFVAAWMMTSLGLHRLLLHYSDRPAAQRAAWTKFAVSRLGDAALVGALTLIYVEFRTFDFSEIFSIIKSQAPTGSAPVSWAGWLLVIGAITKSAQIPFHTWLPLTMETPTPVSALMHAGIVNAGGYLIIRTSPLVAATPSALGGLALVGAATACFAAIVMLTQTSVKKTLAYSTIAQMGFMMLQCGLGAYSAAMLHILAHSLYKAHAFLSSGSVIQQRKATRLSSSSPQPVRWSLLAILATAIVTFLTISLAAFGLDPIAKPGGVLLAALLSLALMHWNWQVLRCGDRQLLIRSMAVSGALCLTYAASFAAVDSIVAASLPAVTAPTMAWFVAAVVIAGFAGMLSLQISIASGNTPRWIDGWYVHASNGFYLENLFRRLFGGLASS